MWRILVEIGTWLRSWFVRPVRPLQTVYVEELPDLLDPKAVYILGQGRHLWFVALLCPCGCNEVLQVSLLPDAKPKWSLIEHADDGSITLQPSVWRKIGCRSHFFLRRGRVLWCSEYRMS